MAIRQGSLDCLCGIYSVMNATEIVIGNYQVDRKLPKKRMQKRALFYALVRYFAKRNMLEKVLTEGIDEIDERGGLIDIAIKSVKKHQKVKMLKQTAFNEDPETLDKYWEKLTLHLMHKNTSAIVNISGRLEHWTCIKEIAPDRLVLADSTGIKQLYRHQCTIGDDEKGMYTLWPTMTYLLSID